MRQNKIPQSKIMLKRNVNNNVIDHLFNNKYSDLKLKDKQKFRNSVLAQKNKHKKKSIKLYSF